MTPRRWLVLLSLLSPWVLAACAEEEALCPALGSYSLAVRVVDQAGAAVPDAKVESGFDGRPLEPATCGERTASGGCARWDVGGSPGTFLLRASRADGSSPREATVVVANSGTASCPFPAKQDIDLVLAP